MIERYCKECGGVMYVPVWISVFDVLSLSEHDVYFCEKCGWKEVKP